MQTTTVVTPHRYWSPRVTWTAIGTGVVAILGAVAPIATALVGLHDPIATLVGQDGAQRVSAVCSIVAAVSLVVAGRGRSIDPAIDTAKVPTSPSTTP